MFEAKSKNRRAIFLGSGLIIVILVVTFFVLHITGVISFGSDKNNKNEGDGYPSADAAALAYAKGFAEQDLEGMIEACAIESYVENVDAKATIEYYKAIIHMAIQDQALINNDNILGELNSEYRRYTMEYYIYYQYMVIAVPNLLVGGESIFFNEEDDEEIYDFAEKLDKAGDLKGLTNVTVGGTESPSAYVDDFDSEYKRENKYRREYFANQAKLLGAEKIEDAVVNLEVNGEPYLMFLDMVKYDDRWYVLQLGGAAAYKAGLNVDNAGLISQKELGLLGADDGADDGE
jgi:hypothetical protein